MGLCNKMKDQIRLIKGDCLKVMDELKREGAIVDAVIVDPPYGVTKCEWDSIIPLELMWDRIKSMIKPNAAIAITATQPFATKLISSNPSMFRYDLIWLKSQGSSFFMANKMPMRAHEGIYLFYNSPPTYNPQKTQGEPYASFRKKSSFDLWNDSAGNILTENKDGLRYPLSYMNFKNSNKGKIHPTQKPVALMEYLIKTYTNEGETVLDFTMGSGTTGEACLRCNRKFIGIEISDEYFSAARERLDEFSLEINEC